MMLPFRGLVYNTDIVGSMANVISPPYDVISPELQKQLFARSEFNFCRLDLPAQDGPTRYAAAKALWLEWREKKVFLEDKRPAIYWHRHSFYLPNGRKIARQGFFAACVIEDFSAGKVLPHEKTLDAPKLDRLEMTRATHAQLSPVFSLYDDPQNQASSLFADVIKSTPFCDFTTEDAERHEIWKIQDPAHVENLASLLSQKQLFIADGHHRYETALNYRNELLQNHPDLPAHAAARFVLMYCVNINDPGLVILPIHRCLRDFPNFNSQSIVTSLEKHFEVKTFPRDLWQQAHQEQTSLANSQHAFLFMPSATESENIFLISLSHEKAKTLAQQNSWPQALADLDVTVLHREILQNQIGISEADLAKQAFLDYEKTTEAALQRLKNGSAQAVFLMNPTRIEQMQAVAGAGLKMPQKSTFFYPKIASGLVVHDVDESRIDGFVS